MTQEPDTAPGNYYVSVRRDDGDTRFLAGPFRDDHAGALAMVDAAKRLAERDPKAHWYSYGTARTGYDYAAPGIFNAELGLSTGASMPAHHRIVFLPDGKFDISSHNSPEDRDARLQGEEQRHVAADQQSDLDALTGTDLFDLYNHLAVKPIGVMKDKAWLAPRVWALLNPRAAPGEAFVTNDAASDAGNDVTNADGDPAAAQPEGETNVTSTNETTAPKKAKRVAKPKKARIAKPKAERKAKIMKAKTNGHDAFGLRAGSKASAAAAMFARAAGATMADVREKTGANQYNLLASLADAGHKVKKDGKTIFLTAK